MADFSFCLETDLTPIRETKLVANFEETEAAIKEMLAPYSGMVVTEDAISDAKNIKARINKVKAAIDDNRKGVKAIYTEPLKAYEEKCKKLTAICDAAYTNIDSQVKAFEEAKRTAKLEQARQYFVSSVSEFDPDERYLRWDDVCDTRFGNASMPEQTVRDTIDAAIAKCRADVDAIRSIDSQFETTLLDYYSKHHDISTTFKLNAELTKRAEEDAKRKAEQEEAIKRKKMEELERIQNAFNESVSEKPKEPAPAVVADEPDTDPEITMVFKVVCRKSQLTGLGQYMKDNGIRYGRA